MKSFDHLFSFRNWSVKHKYAFYNWDNQDYVAFMLDILKRLYPRFEEPNQILWNELDE